VADGLVVSEHRSGKPVESCIESGCFAADCADLLFPDAGVGIELRADRRRCRLFVETRAERFLEAVGHQFAVDFAGVGFVETVWLSGQKIRDER
jgi:hypothetical protein